MASHQHGRGSLLPQVEFQAPAIPFLSLTPTLDPLNQCPQSRLNFNAYDNLMTTDTSGFISSIGTWSFTGTSTPVLVANTILADGSNMMAATMSSTTVMSGITADFV